MTVIPAVIAWAFTLTFLIALVLVLLDVAGVRRIADETQRRWLFRSLFASVILAVTGFGTWQFEAFRRPAEPVAQAKASDSTLQAAPSQPSQLRRDEPAATTHSNDPAAPARRNEAPAPATAPLNAELAAWAAATLGERPSIPAAFDTDYPTCVAELGGRAYADIDPADAAACRTRLEEHHTRYIVAFYRAKEAYDRALRNQELAFRRGGLQDGETPRFNLVVAENRDFNDPGGPTLQRIDEAEARILQDKARCRTRRCSRES